MLHIEEMNSPQSCCHWTPIKYNSQWKITVWISKRSRLVKIIIIHKFSERLVKRSLLYNNSVSLKERERARERDPDNTASNWSWNWNQYQIQSHLISFNFLSHILWFNEKKIYTISIHMHLLLHISTHFQFICFLITYRIWDKKCWCTY